MRGALTMIVLAAAAAGFAGCGSSGQKIPASNASDLIARLQEAQQRSGGKPDCNGLSSSTLPALEAGLSGLPPSTDKDIRATLKEGVDNLRNLVQAKCTQPSTTSSSSSTTSSSTSTATPPPTTTRTTSTTTTAPPPPTPPPPPTTTTTRSSSPTSTRGGGAVGP
ncbi:MAG: hypothetical protein JOZ25_12505 [Actinobacteria bacterium]|nr:hypothetical protein [Actinomycetota bacterium]